MKKAPVTFLFTVLLVLCMALGAAPVPAASASPAALVLDDATSSIQAWPAVTVLADPQGILAINDVAASRTAFAVPQSANGTLGMRREVMWLHIPLTVAGGSDGEWVFDVDYAPLQNIGLYIFSGDDLAQRATLGSLHTAGERPMASRSHAVALQLIPGKAYDMYLRVETMGAMVLPITFSKPTAFHANALNEQMLQGLLSGLALTLLVSSLAQWVTLREHLFGKYALLISGSLLFTWLQFGIGMQYVWPGNVWMETHAGGLSALVAATGSFLFIEQALAGPDMKPWLSKAMKGGAVLTITVALCYALDWINVHTVTAVVSTLGLAPALLGMPGAITRARRGETVGIYFLLAWAVYFVTTAVLIEALKGRLPVNFWTLHSFQFGATFDMLVFMRILSLRTKALQSAMRLATRERDKFHTMAHTDPLTGLPNRRSLNETITRELTTTNPQNMLAVYMLDLDGFKTVNDLYGHDVGDELLIAVANRLQANLRNSDIVSRLGGDEFVIMSSGLTTAEQAQELGEKLVRAFDVPCVLTHQVCKVGLTIGYALAPLDEHDIFGLLKLADGAMYAGKMAGKHCVHRAAPGAGSDASRP
ncbi:MAG: diguanylate cyclase [Rhodoferax sp.]|nr:diguanylate cyclase [Rhodoferax sp.]